jgi:uncharacterized membrane protein
LNNRTKLHVASRLGNPVREFLILDFDIRWAAAVIYANSVDPCMWVRACVRTSINMYAAKQLLTSALGALASKLQIYMFTG